jgi:hypothetical protein
MYAHANKQKKKEKEKKTYADLWEGKNLVIPNQ